MITKTPAMAPAQASRGGLLRPRQQQPHRRRKHEQGRANEVAHQGEASQRRVAATHCRKSTPTRRDRSLRRASTTGRQGSVPRRRPRRRARPLRGRQRRRRACPTPRPYPLISTSSMVTAPSAATPPGTRRASRRPRPRARLRLGRAGTPVWFLLHRSRPTGPSGFDVLGQFPAGDPLALHRHAMRSQPLDERRTHGGGGGAHPARLGGSDRSRPGTARTGPASRRSRRRRGPRPR